jgi:RNA polymerase sigma-70 factor (ECF subfamily)
MADRKEMSIIVRGAIQSLNERQRMALLLSKFEGMSYQEIGHTMNLSNQAVKSLLSRARENLRGILESYMESGTLPDVPPDQNNNDSASQLSDRNKSP